MRHPLEITFDTDGWSFVREIFNSVYGYTAIGVVLLIGLLYIILKENRENIYIFVVPIVLMCCTIYNPVFVKLILYKLVGQIYYRFFWILPIATLFIYVFIHLLQDNNERKKRIGIIILLGLVLFWGGRMVTERGINVVTNRYAIPDEVLDISAVIHDNSEKAEVKIIDVSGYAGYLRMYDASLIQPYATRDLENNLGDHLRWVISVDFVVYPISGELNDEIIEFGGVEIARTDNTVIYQMRE